jgi:electron transport complex protein RnfG
MREIIRLTTVLTLVSIVAALMLSQVYSLTREPIAYQKRLEKMRAIKAVLPAYDNEPDKDFVELVAGKNRQGEEAKIVFYRAKIEEKINGVAFLVTSNEGYSGNIEIMLGITPEGTVTGIEVLTHAETPGLGAKIVDEKFRNQMKERNLTNTNWTVKKDGGDIDQITGATISPRAVVKAIKEGLLFYKDHKEEIIR